MMMRWVSAALLLAGMATVPAVDDPARAAPAPCAAQRPSELKQGATIWYGPCPRGRAAGLGVLRVGTGPTYEFFAGRMAAGRPDRGVLLFAAGTFSIAAGFDAKLAAVDPSGAHPDEPDQIVQLAVGAAHATAQRFATQGNRGSAAYYQRLASHIDSMFGD